MLSNGDKQEDASNAMENIFLTRPNNQQRHPSYKSPVEQNLRRARNSWKHYANDNGLSISADQGQRRHSGNILQVTTLTQDGVVSQKMWHVDCGTKDQSLYTPYLCLDTRFVDVILRFSETHQSIQSIPI